METFKDRLIAEQKTLRDNLSKLSAFIISAPFDKIDPVQQSLLQIQLKAMDTYNYCLIERIEWLTKNGQ